MAKQGQHKHDSHDPRISPGNNNPSKSTPITTGTPKKRETYEKEAREHKNTAPQAQYAKNEWDADTRDYASTQEVSARRAAEGEHRSGSDSNADTGTRGH